MGKSWHKEHFTCTSCESQLHGKKYKEENEMIYCSQCYGKYVAVKCQKCQEAIGISSTKVTVGTHAWHKECFSCKRCREKLQEKKYYIVDGDLLCLECKGDQAAAQCHGCKNAISSTVSFIQHKKYSWHVECFKCVVCQTWLANGEFHEINDNLTCTNCYTTKTGTKCAVCQETILKKGIKFGLKTYHQECFRCSGCDKILIGEKSVKEKNGEPICHDCCLKVSKKCCRCKHPITSRHTLYKGFLFHVECFKCNLCGSSIDNAEFFETSLNEILCKKCARID